MTDSVLVIGSGAMASLFAARISRSGGKVAITDTWAPGLDAIRKDGIRLVEGGHTSSHYIQVFDQSLETELFSEVLILTKAYQTSAAVRIAEKYLKEDGTVLSLQNGLSARSKIIEILGENRVLTGITTCAAQTLSPGVVKYNGGNLIKIGNHPAVEKYAEILRQAGFDVTIEAYITQMVWEKVLLNAAINPPGALLRLTNGQLKDNPDAKEIMTGLLIEGCEIANAIGLSFDPEKMAARLDSVLEDTAMNQCSMLQDILNGRQTEIDDINGALVKIAEEHTIAVPMQKTVTRLIQALQRKGTHGNC